MCVCVCVCGGGAAFKLAKKGKRFSTLMSSPPKRWEYNLGFETGLN